jgi:hypothetical protein
MISPITYCPAGCESSAGRAVPCSCEVLINGARTSRMLIDPIAGLIVSTVPAVVPPERGAYSEGLAGTNPCLGVPDLEFN